MLDISGYLLSVTGLLLAVGSLLLGAMRVRSRLLNGWSGMPALLADAVLTLGLLIWIAELIGAVGMLKQAPLIAACLGVGLALRFAVRPPSPGTGQPPPAPPARRSPGSCLPTGRLAPSPPLARV
jgi:hypothetical protein